MYWQDVVLAGSAMGGSVLAILALILPGRRLARALPAVILLLLAMYERHMSAWEKTVHAPIRVDMFLEIPLMFGCLAWGVVAVCGALLAIARTSRDKAR